MTDAPPTGATPATPYEPPVADVLLALRVAGLDEVLALDDFADVDADTVDAVITQFGRFAAEVIAPSDRESDLVGSHLDPEKGTVSTPAALREAYAAYVEGGWGALQFPPEYGGAGLPGVVGLAMQEMLAAANMSLSLNPVLTQGAIELLLSWGDEQQRERFVPKLLTGEWTGTMDLTEPEAGSDLGGVAMRAERGPDGTWRLHGTKIFITWGEHDLADNIVHLVLARTPDGAPGTRGLSLFLVPKYLLDSSGEPGERNALHCVGLEDKLGIHASPTCVMRYDGAIGELVGAEGSGLRAMFTMMNTERLSIGSEGPGIAERAYQHALSYAQARRQGRASGVQPPARSAIIEHPDVRRMLLTMRTSTLAARLLLYTAAAQGDLARHGADEAARARGQALVDLLTPVAKAWSTEVGVSVSSLGIQVFGGMGYVEESGIAQRLRDARIGPIYEGTNGIQAIDLVTRKIGREGGAHVRGLLDGIEETLKTGAAHSGGPGEGLAPTLEALGEAHEVLGATTDWLLRRLEDAPDDALAGATAYCELLGITVGGWLLARRAILADELGHPLAATAVAESNFFASETLGRAVGLRRPITAGAARLASAAHP